MGSDSPMQIPGIDLSNSSPDIDRGTEEWLRLCKRVREACEDYGCFEVVYDKISKESRGETFGLMKEIFELPLETKKKNSSTKPYHGYAGDYAGAPLYESLGIEDASNFQGIKNFAQLMWPQGHDQFCETFSTTAKQMKELHHLIEMLILDGYGLGNKMESISEYMLLVRIMRYEAPANGEYMNGLSPHTDKPLWTLLCEDKPGLEVETRDGKWTKLSISHNNSFIFLVGDPLMAWSNGRLHPAKHRVMMSGDKDRYSFAAFADATNGTIIKTPKELVDEDHPQLFNDFDYIEFLNFSMSQELGGIESSKRIFAFAGN